jgi:acylpyruvate hydrolase
MQKNLEIQFLLFLFFFLKPTTSYVRPNNFIEIPLNSDVHHEVELGVVIGKKGRDISSKEAMDFVAGYALCLDLTCRNLQTQAKNQGLPWTISKGFDTFCPVGDFIDKQKISDPHNIELWLKVDGQLKQKGNTNQMIFKIPQLIEYISSIMTLEVGDLILTGTPEGVGPIKSEQIIEAGISEIYEMKFQTIMRPSSSSKIV